MDVYFEMKPVRNRVSNNRFNHFELIDMFEQAVVEGNYSLKLLKFTFFFEYWFFESSVERGWLISFDWFTRAEMRSQTTLFAGSFDVWRAKQYLRIVIKSNRFY